MTQLSTPLKSLTLSLALAGSCSAANIFFSFQTEPNGSFGTQSVTAFEGIASGTPTISITGTGGGINQGSEASFTDFEGTTWTGSGASGTPGRNMTWGSASSGNSFSLQFDATGLENMFVRFAVRSAAGGDAITTFTDLTYDLDGAGGNAAVSTGLTLDSYTNDSLFTEWSIDLSSIAAIENQSDVTLTWVIPDVLSGDALRIDNFQLSTIPEPSAFALMLGTLSLLLVARRRR